MADLNILRSGLEVSDLQNLEIPRKFYSSIQRFVPITVGEKALSTGGGVEAITITGLQVGDRAIVSLLTDDGGTPITSLIAVVTANTLTITRNDDGSSTDTGVAIYAVYRPEG